MMEATDSQGEVGMRKGFVGLMASAMLAGCGGSGGTDFTVNIARAPDDVVTAIATIDSGLTNGADFKTVRREAGEGRSIRLILPAAEGNQDGTITMEVADGQNGGAVLAVAVDLPAVRDGNMVLSEQKAEKVLEDAFREWAKKFETGSGSTMGVDLALGAVAVATQRPQMITASDEARESLVAQNEAALTAKYASEFGPAPSSRIAAGQPMTVPTGSTDMTRPMMDTSGVAPRGIQPKGVNPNAGL